jgi:thiol:disulfide interchange protein
MMTAIFLIAFTFKVIGIDCAGCGPPIIRALAAVPGVKNAKVDTKTSMATVDIAAGFDKSKLRAAVSNAGFEAEFPGETRTDIAPLPPEVVKTLDIVAYDGKSKVDIAKALAPGKVTVVDFYADWCGPCHVLEARLQRYMLAHPTVALRRIDIGKWNNAGARQATQFGAEALPYVRVYDAKGKLVEAVVGGMWDEVLEAMEKAEKR